MYVRKLSVVLTTDASGDVTGYTPVFTGAVSQIRYVKDTYDNGVDFTVTVDGTGETVWAENDVNASATRAPRQPTHSTAGVASLFAAAGAAVNDLIAVSHDRLKIVIAQGGNVKAGTVHVLVV